MMNNTISVLDDKVRLNIPDEFSIMSDEEAKHFFQNTTPDILYGIEDKKAFISITKTDIKIEDDNIDSRLAQYYELYRRSVANFSNGKLAKRTLNNGKPIGAFHYTSTSAERNLLNFFVLFPLDDNEVVMTMHCSAEDSPILGGKFMQVANTIPVTGT